jgi:hypothetical protein
MATTEQKQELVEDIKRPIRYYRLSISGYGGEGAYLGLSQEAWEYWKNKIDTDGDESLIDYLVDPDTFDGDLSRDADFQCDAEGYRHAWYESPHEIVHQYGVDINSCYITINEVETENISSDIVDAIIDSKEFSEFREEHKLWDNVEVEDIVEDEQPYMLQAHSAEKGVFYEGVLTVQGKFDPTKLTFHTIEHWNGDEVIDEILYNDELVENFGADTRGKGFSVHLWKNE